VLGAAVATLAVDDDRRRQHDTPDRIAAASDPLEQRRRAAAVGVDGAAHVDHRLSVADDAAEVEDAVHAGERTRDVVVVAQIGPQQLDVGRGASWRGAGVRERIEVVEHANSSTAPHERVDEVAADEARAAGDEHRAPQRSGVAGSRTFIGAR
jgi:hypothetical protein